MHGDNIPVVLSRAWFWDNLRSRFCNPLLVNSYVAFSANRTAGQLHMFWHEPLDLDVALELFRKYLLKGLSTSPYYVRKCNRYSDKAIIKKQISLPTIQKT